MSDNVVTRSYSSRPFLCCLGWYYAQYSHYAGIILYYAGIILQYAGIMLHYAGIMLNMLLALLPHQALMPASKSMLTDSTHAVLVSKGLESLEQIVL